MDSVIMLSLTRIWGSRGERGVKRAGTGVGVGAGLVAREKAVAWPIRTTRHPSYLVN